MVIMMNIRLVILGLMALILGGKLYGQEGSRGRLGILFGGMNGVSYDYSLNSHFEVGASALLGLGLGYDNATGGVSYSGFTPALEVTPRYFFSRRQDGELFHKGAYLSVRFEGQMDKWTLFPSRAIRESDRKYQYTLAFVPTFGWSIPVGETSFVRLGAGISFYRQKSIEAGVTFWDTRSGTIPIQLEITYGIAL